MRLQRRLRVILLQTASGPELEEALFLPSSEATEALSSGPTTVAAVHSGEQVGERRMERVGQPVFRASMEELYSHRNGRSKFLVDRIR